MRNLIFDGGYQQGYARGEADGEALRHEQLDLAFQQGHNRALTERAVVLERRAYEEGFRKGKGKGTEVGYTEGWGTLQELRVPRGVHDYLMRLVDADEAQVKALGDLAWRGSAHNIMGARNHLADIEPDAPNRDEEAGMLEALRRARTRSPRALRLIAADRQFHAGH